MVIGYKAWKEQAYLLDRMTLRDLSKAFFTYPGVQIYLALVAVLAVYVALTMDSLVPHLLTVAAVIVIYPLVWYVLHRWVLHSQLLYKSEWTAALWKRIHFDHHQNPGDMAVLFGGLHTTLPTILIATGPVGAALAGTPGMATAVATGILITCYYEYCHCIQHLGYAPKSGFLKRIKQLHMAHHYHNETGNFGITNYFWDRVFGTYYQSNQERPRSATVRNLGYAGAEAERYPWVARLTSDSDSGASASTSS